MYLKTATLNGKHIGYSADTDFLVQIGKGRKGAYRTVATFTGNLAGAVIHYQGLNITNGYKKRLYMPSSRKPVLHKDCS